jgi:hypothetical protein
MASTSPNRLELTIKLTLVCAMIVAIIGCADRTSFGGEVDGKLVNLSEAFQRSSVGRTVILEGRIHEVCRDEGCWFIVSDSSHELTVRYVDETGLGIPVISRGSRVRVKGKIRDTIIGRNRIPELRATGVLLMTE